MIASGPKPKCKFDLYKAKCYKCPGKGHMAKDYLTKSEPKNKAHLFFLIAWDKYKFGGDNDISHVDNVEFTHVARCLMSRSHANSSIFVNTDDDVIQILIMFKKRVMLIENLV